jgi:hypothetical protein
LIGYPVDRIGVGVVGPLPKSKNNNRYILVIGDHFTRWMEAYPLPNQQAETIADNANTNPVHRITNQTPPQSSPGPPTQRPKSTTNSITSNMKFNIFRHFVRVKILLDSTKSL